MTTIGSEPSVALTDCAQSVLRSLEADHEEPIAIILNDGCCDGMGPVVTTMSMVGVNDRLLGTDGEIEVYVPPNRRAIRDGYEIQIDATKMEGVGSFSLEVPYGYRLMADEQWKSGD